MRISEHSTTSRISEHSITSNLRQVINDSVEDSDKLIKGMDKHPMDQPEFNDYALSYGEEDKTSDDESDHGGLEHFALLKTKAIRLDKMIERRNKRRGYNVKKTQQCDNFCNASVSSLEVDMGGNFIDEESDDDSDCGIDSTPLRFNSLGRFDVRPTFPISNSLGRFDSMAERPLSRCDSLDCGMGTMPTRTRRNSDCGPPPIRQKSKRCLSDLPESSVEARLRTQRRDSRIADSSDSNRKRDSLLASVGKAVKLQSELSAQEKNRTNRTATAGPILSDKNKEPHQSPECRWSPDISRDSVPNLSHRSR